MTDVDVGLALYREFVAGGRAPSADRLAELLEQPEAEVREALERLAAGRAIVLQPESREVLLAPPLSASRRPSSSTRADVVLRAVRLDAPGRSRCPAARGDVDLVRRSAPLRPL